MPGLAYPDMRSDLLKNISKKGPRNCRSLGFARDDKGESGCWRKASFGGPLEVMNKAFSPETTFYRKSLFPLSSRAKARDLQFSGPFMETRNSVLKQICHLARSVA
jgi:hypothetical protein